MKKAFFIVISIILLLVLFVLFLIIPSSKINYKHHFGVNKQLLSIFNDSIINKFETGFCSSEKSEKRTYSSFYISPNIIVSVFELNDAPIKKSLDNVNVLYQPCDLEYSPKIIFDANNNQPKELSEDFLFTDNLSVYLGDNFQTQKIIREQNAIFIWGNHKQISLCDDGKLLMRVNYKRKKKSNLFIINNFKNKLRILMVYSETYFDESILNIFKPNIFE
jgi:hypothetical protein